MVEPDPSQVRTLVGKALELPPAQRAEFVARECGGDPALQVEVERLLALAGSIPPNFLEPPGPPAHVPEPAPEVPPERHQLGEFEILREIGRGGMGVVYLARQRTLDRLVAVKVLVEGLTTTARDIERFHREARSAARLSHPGIVRVLTDGKTGSAHWFAMELVDGHDLRREIKLQRDRTKLAGEAPLLPLPGTSGHMAAVARVCAEVAEALHHAHCVGLVHRDVKPANLLLARDGRVLIVDFGLVRDESLGTLTRSGDLAGTPHYMSPEQARVRSAKVDHRTDVYSLGVVLYELASLRRPFDDGSSQEIISQIRDHEPKHLRAIAPGAPRDLDLICATAMAKDPDQRYQDAAALAHDLRRFLSHESILAQPPSMLERGRRWARANRRPLAAAALIAAGLALGTTGTAAWARGRGQARLEVAARSADGQLLRGRVRASWLDPITAEAAAARDVGRNGLRGARFQPGWWRIRVELEGAGVLELDRQLESGETLAVTPVVREDVPGTEGMVRIEAGTLSLRDSDAPLSSLNLRDIPVAAFWLDECEVSNGEYRRFLAATGKAPPRDWAKIVPGLHDELPVVAVGWEEAREYAEWQGKRLPTLTEWVWAARGPEGRIYPWPDAVPGELRGNASKPRDSISNASDLSFYLDHAEPVRSFPEACTASGLYHMFGNVAEWTGSPFAERTPNGFEPRPAQRYIAGYAWDGGTRKHTLAHTAFSGIEQSYADTRVGFRCARSSVSPEP